MKYKENKLVAPVALIEVTVTDIEEEPQTVYVCSGCNNGFYFDKKSKRTVECVNYCMACGRAVGMRISVAFDINIPIVGIVKLSIGGECEDCDDSEDSDEYENECF